MFVSAATDFQVHCSTPQGVQNYEIKHPASLSKITSVSICNDNSYIALLHENEKPQIFSVKDPNNIRLIHIINVSNISALTFKRKTKKCIALGTSTGDVIMYDTKTRNVGEMYSKVMDYVRRLDFTCDDQQLCGFDGSVFFVFPEIGVSNQMKRYKQNSECSFLKCHDFIPERAAIGCVNGEVTIWNVSEGLQLIKMELFQSPVNSIAFSSTGEFLVASAKDLKFCNLNYATGSFSSVFHFRQDQPVTAVDLCQNDKLLAVGFNDGNVKLFDAKDALKPLYSFKAHQNPVSIIVFENTMREANSNLSSLMKIADEMSNTDFVSEVSHCSAATVQNVNKKVPECREDLDKLKKYLMRIIKTEMDSLECQMQEHCAKFQKFMDNEFETIDQILKKKWDVFKLGDLNQIVTAICPDDGKNNE